MLLNQLFESVKANAAFAFGRFNPPHKGHVAVWNTVAKSGAEWFIGTNPGTSGPKDPLPYDVKTEWMTAIDPSVKGHVMPETSVLTLAVSIYKQLGERQGLTVAYITDDQDWAWSGKLLNDYNGKEATHGYYNFAKIVHVPSPRVSSATALRDAARAGDAKAFYAAAGVDPKLTVDGKNYYDTVVDYLAQHPIKVKKTKKVAEPVAQEDAAGVGVIASKKQAKDPRYSMSLTKDVRPGAVEKALKAFRLESMLPKSAFAGTGAPHYHKLGQSAQLKGKTKRAARAGDLVGGDSIQNDDKPVDEKWSQKYKNSINCSNPKGFSQRAHCAGRKKNEDVVESEEIRSIQNYLNKKYDANLDVDGKLGDLTKQTIKKFMPKSDKKLAPEPNKTTAVQGKEIKKEMSEEKQKGVDGKACWDGYKRMGTKKKGGKTVDNCVKIGESYENKIASLIEVLSKK